MVSSGFIPILGPTHSQTFAEAPQWYPLHTPPRQQMPLHVQGTASPGDGHHGMHDEPSWSVSWTHSPLHRNARGSGQAYSCDIQPTPARGRMRPCHAITPLGAGRPTQEHRAQGYGDNSGTTHSTRQNRRKADTLARIRGQSEAGAPHPAGQPLNEGRQPAPHRQPRARYGCSPVWATIPPFPVCVSPQRSAHAPAGPFAPGGHARRAHPLSFHALP